MRPRPGRRSETSLATIEHQWRAVSLAQVAIFTKRKETDSAGHCRGRKIRCIPALSDVENRCQSCIRLKRECSFKPTDQQRGTESRSRTAQAHIEQRSSQSSSPTPSNNDAQPPPQRQFPPLPTHAPHMRPPMSGPPMGNGAMGKLSHVYASEVTADILFQ